ncbi:MAG TPA: hypothetical protein VGG84_05880 [Gemmatimonadaceae bacterium]
MIAIGPEEGTIEKQQPAQQDQEDRADESREQPEPNSLALE